VEANFAIGTLDAITVLRRITGRRGVPITLSSAGSVSTRITQIADDKEKQG
jgi:hypothetical protein